MRKEISSTAPELSSPGMSWCPLWPCSQRFSLTPLGGEGAGGFLPHCKYPTFPSLAFPKGCGGAGITPAAPCPELPQPLLLGLWAVLCPSGWLSRVQLECLCPWSHGGAVCQLWGQCASCGGTASGSGGAGSDWAPLGTARPAGTLLHVLEHTGGLAQTRTCTGKEELCSGH